MCKYAARPIHRLTGRFLFRLKLYLWLDMAASSWERSKMYTNQSWTTVILFSSINWLNRHSEEQLQWSTRAYGLSADEKQLHYITLQYITEHYSTLQNITVHYRTSHYRTLQYITEHHITEHYSPGIRDKCAESPVCRTRVITKIKTWALE